MDKLCFIFLSTILLAHVVATQQNAANTKRMEISYSSYQNWGQTINGAKPYMVLYPETSNQVVLIVNWAYKMNKKVRVQGLRHNYSPLTVSNDDDPHKTIIIDMTRHMKRLRMGSIIGNSKLRRTVITEPGATMEDFMAFAEQNGYGIVMSPIIGSHATVGGVLATGGHGAGIAALNEKLISPGFTFGSVSNLIAELKAVVWDSLKQCYVIKRFSRTDSDIAAFIVHIGRAIITEVTLMVGGNYNMRCLSRVDIPDKELFAHPENVTALRTMASLLDSFGRVDAIWFPFTKNPWIKIWEVTGVKPRSSRLTTHPYNYQFAFTENNPLTPGTDFGPQALKRVIQGLTKDEVWDFWGRSKNTILHYNRTSIPLVFSGFVVLTNRANIQLVLHDMVQFYLNLLNKYAARGHYPIDQYIKFRATGLDDPIETYIPGAVMPDISPLSPIPSRADFNAGIWMNTLTTTNRPHSKQFSREFEQWANQRFNGKDAQFRPEWSKSWGFTNEGAFADKTFIRETIPTVFGVHKWNHAVNVLDQYDPYRVMSNQFLSELMVPYQN